MMHCPNCFQIINLEDYIKRYNTIPEEGNATVCAECGELLEFHYEPFDGTHEIRSWHGDQGLGLWKMRDVTKDHFRKHQPKEWEDMLTTSTILKTKQFHPEYN